MIKHQCEIVGCHLWDGQVCHAEGPCIYREENLEAENADLRARVERLEGNLRLMLRFIEEYTGLPSSAANGVVSMGIDEGVIRTAEALDEAKAALEGGGE